MISSVRIENLRSLRDTGHISLRPLTILIGGNSSGKSTFLRSFPLMSQTVSHNLRTAIAWFDESSVDFGDFTTSKTKNVDDDFIKFTYCLNPEFSSEFRHRMNHVFNRKKQIQYDLWELALVYKQRSDGKGVYLDCLEISYNSNKSVIEFRDKEIAEIYVNGDKISNLSFNYSPNLHFGLIPQIHYVTPKQEAPKTSEEIYFQALSSLKKYCPRKLKHTERIFSVWRCWSEKPDDFLKNLHNYTDLKFLAKIFEKWTVDNKEFINLYNSIYIVKLLSILQLLNRQLTLYFDNCDYVAPLRAEAMRYTRFQGLQVSRVDAYGRNLSEFIDSLTDTQRSSLNEYIERTLGVKVRVRNATGHQSITILSNGGETNMADVGFGFSQILPIVTKLWQMQERSRFNSLSFYRSPFAVGLIEQPELHLHPALQAKLADAFVKTALNEDAITSLIIETHSPTIVNRIGRRIREGHILPEDVNIVIFDKDSTTGHTKVKNTCFLPNGRIEDWPSGFFEPESDPF